MCNYSSVDLSSNTSVGHVSSDSSEDTSPVASNLVDDVIQVSSVGSGFGWASPCLINNTPTKDTMAIPVSVNGKPYIGTSIPNSAICGMARIIATVGMSEYMLLRIRFGMTSRSIRWVRISANPPKKLVAANVMKARVIGMTDCSGMLTMTKSGKGNITLIVGAPGNAGGKI